MCCQRQLVRAKETTLTARKYEFLTGHQRTRTVAVWRCGNFGHQKTKKKAKNKMLGQGAKNTRADY